MDWAKSEPVGHPENEQVLLYLRDASAHSDVSDALIRAVEPLGDVQAYSPNPARYRFLTASTRGVVFGFAVGMNSIGFRLNPVLKSRALATGAEACPQAGPDWVCFTLFRNDWPAFDLSFWARKAYARLRERPPGPTR
jgi:hypothetical protein